jgi:hypothetical protein
MRLQSQAFNDVMRIKNLTHKMDSVFSDWRSNFRFTLQVLVRWPTLCGHAPTSNTDHLKIFTPMTYDVLLSWSGAACSDSTFDGDLKRISSLNLITPLSCTGKLHFEMRINC